MGAYLYCFTSEWHLVKKKIKAMKNQLALGLKVTKKSQLNVGLKLEKD